MQAASNIAASAKAGMDKTKAVVQEKAEKMTTRDPIQKEIAEEKKQVKIHEAEQMKMETRAQNEAAKHSTTGGLGGLTHGTHGTHGTTGITHGTHGTTGLTHGTHGTHGTTGLHDPTHGVTTGGVGTGTGTGTGHTGIGGLLGKGTGHTGVHDPRV